MKLSKYAKLNGVSYTTAYRWFKSGMISNSRQLPNGTILVDEITNNNIERIVTYSRVSNASRRAELDYQVNRINSFCENRGVQIHQSYKEVASGMNDSRKQLWKMIDSKPTLIVIENKDRLTRFGFEYICRLLEKQGTKILIINESESDEQDLIRDLVSIITSFCCRLYGLRRGYNKAKTITEKVQND
jgi:putative resolvase